MFRRSYDQDFWFIADGERSCCLLVGNDPAQWSEVEKPSRREGTPDCNRSGVKLLEWFWLSRCGSSENVKIMQTARFKDNLVGANETSYLTGVNPGRETLLQRYVDIREVREGEISPDEEVLNFCTWDRSGHIFNSALPLLRLAWERVIFGRKQIVRFQSSWAATESVARLFFSQLWTFYARLFVNKTQGIPLRLGVLP